MKKEKQPNVDPHIDAPSEANREKHINFREVEEESAGNFSIDKTTSERQKQWRKEIEEGEEEKRKSGEVNDNSIMPMDEDDTIGVP